MKEEDEEKWKRRPRKWVAAEPIAAAAAAGSNITGRRLDRR